MKISLRTTLLPLALMALTCQVVTAASSVSVKPNTGRGEQDKIIIKPTPKLNLPIERNSDGNRLIDMTNPDHAAVVFSRFEKAGLSAEKFPQLFANQDRLRQQQLMAAAFPTESTANLTEADVNGIIKNAHFFVDSNFGIAEDNGKPYLFVRARSSVFGGTLSTYADLLLEDQYGRAIAPIGSDISYADGKDTSVISIVSLDNLKRNFPDLTMVVASSFVEVEFPDNSLEGRLKYTQFPFDWATIESRYGLQGAASAEGLTSAAVMASALDAAPTYIATDPVDKNNDNVIKVCLNRSHTDCDYPLDQSLPNATTLVQIPFSGTLVVNHKIEKIWASNELPPELDESTNIYVQEGNYGGASMPKYSSMNNGNKMFSDYVKILEVDDVNKTTKLGWDIPRPEGVFGNALLFSNRDEVLWNITFAVHGYPFFQEGGRGRGASNFQIALSTEENARFGNFYAPVLKKLKFGYSCLAEDTLIDMADGTQRAIAQIHKGDLVLGAGAKTPQVTEAMVVTDVSVGVEVIPMVRIVTTDGNEVLMTETHPVVTANNGIVWAKELVAGDRLLNATGSSLISSVSREAYDKGVYNLELAPLADSILEPGAELAMFANGILVGDLSMQDDYNYRTNTQVETTEQVLERLPVRYHTDYLNSLQLH
jgi:hypothetical protein